LRLNRLPNVCGVDAPRADRAQTPFDVGWPLPAQMPASPARALLAVRLLARERLPGFLEKNC
jgi:hypothetical protein